MTSLLRAMRPVDPPRAPLWAALLLVLALGVLGWALFLALSGGPSGAAPVAAPDPVAAPGPEPTTAPPEPPSSGLLAGEQPLLPPAGVAGPDGELTGLVGQEVRATGVPVQAVAADEGFWVGTGDVDRVWVQLVGDGESPFAVRDGGVVDFTGRVVGHDAGFAGQVGVDPAEGAEQLTRQAAHIEVEHSDLRPAG